MNSDGKINITLNSPTKSEEPLVSIIVITYNSAKYVLETLESTKVQTYKNIELIVSDDCSTDNTVEICQIWLGENKERFVRLELITTDKNTGTSANCNRGLTSVDGDWIKLIAGDDQLLPDCVLQNITWIKNNPGIKLLFSEVEVFSNDFKLNNFNVEFTSSLKFFNLPAERQFEKLLVKNRVMAPSSFIEKDALRKIGGFDERIRNIEDYPFWIKATKAGYKLYYMPIRTVRYRIHSESINPNFSSDKIHNELNQIFSLYQLPNISFGNFIFIWHIFLNLKQIKHSYFKFFKLLSPVWYYEKISRFLTSLNK